MDSILNLSIGFGLLVSLGFSEILGLTAGGLVVPGYMAVFFNQPLVIVVTLFVSVFTYFLVNSLGSIMIIYGRRRTALMIIVGFFIGGILRSYGSLPIPNATVDLALVGYIIPGLIAIWIDRQGILESISTLIIASAVVRILLIVIVGSTSI